MIELTNPDVIGQDLKVWWIPQIPMKAFEIHVNSLATAKVLLETLAEYDKFQFENNVKPDYCNAGGVCMMEDGEWVTFETDDADEIDAMTLAECEKYDHEFYDRSLREASK